MLATQADDLVSKGLEAFNHGHTFLAMTCLEQAAHTDRSPDVVSRLAYCVALNRRIYDQAISLAREALASEPTSPTFCLNLGRIYVMAGMKEEALAVFRQGLSNSQDPAILTEMQALGRRKPPVFSSLSRGHFLNRYLGLILSRLRLR
ncbi:MAG TPA: tetratricopeptide repeat protein [Geobacteraceae bacterium]